MTKGIKDRLHSVDWSIAIADTVISKKEKTRKKIYGASISALAAASLFIILFFSGINSTETPSPGDNIISKQINGIYKDVFSSAAVDSTSSGTSDDYILSSEIDTTIDNSLLSRIDNF